MQTGLHTPAEPERISSGNSPARHSDVRGCQQLWLDWAGAEGQSTKCRQLPPASLPNQVKKTELDELYTFVGKKKTKSMFSQ